METENRDSNYEKGSYVAGLLAAGLAFGLVANAVFRR